MLENFPLVYPLLSEEVEPGFELNLGEAEGEWWEWKPAVTEVPPSSKSSTTITLVSRRGGSHDFKVLGAGDNECLSSVYEDPSRPSKCLCRRRRELLATTSQLGALSWNRWDNAGAACVAGVSHF